MREYIRYKEINDGRNHRKKTVKNANKERTPVNERIQLARFWARLTCGLEFRFIRIHSAFDAYFAE